MIINYAMPMGILNFLKILFRDRIKAVFYIIASLFDKNMLIIF